MTELGWLKDVTFDMLPPQHKKIAEIIGVEPTIKLCATCGGAPMYIPTADGIRSAARAGLIRKEYNGSNVAQLARRFGLTSRMVQIIVQGENPQIDGQISMTDALHITK